MRSERIAVVAAVVGVATLALGAHGNAVGSGFAFDDGHYVTKNAAVRALDVGRLVTEPYWAGAGLAAPYWRPAAMLSFGAQLAVAGPEPSPFHLVNVLLHATTAALLFLLALRFTGSVWESLAGAALFAVHPVGVEAVSSIGHRPDLMAGLFGVAALLLHVGARTVPRVLAAAAALLLACASKEIGISVLAPMLAYDLTVRRARGPSTRAGAGREEGGDVVRGGGGAAWAAYAAVAVAYLAARHAVLGSFTPSRIPFLANPLAAQPFWTQKALALSVLGRCVRLLLWPARLSADYGFHVLELDPGRAAPDALLGACALAGLSWIALRAARREPGITVGIVLAGAAWLPVSNLLFPIEVMMAERLLYVPLLGIALSAASAVARVPWRVLAPAGATVVLALGARTVIRTFDWRGNATLYASAATAYPESARAQFALAQAYRGDGEYSRALAGYDRAVAIWPEFTWALCERAELLRHFQRPEDALASARRALELDPEEPRTWQCYAAELQQAGRLDELVAVLRAATARFPANASLGASLRSAERRAAAR